MVMKKRSLKKAVRLLSGALPIIVAVISLTVHSSMAAEPLSVYVVNYPLKYFAERIGGQHVSVVLPVPADVDPAYWMPDTATISAYQQADLILLNGANYAKWVRKVSLPRSKIVDTSVLFKDRYITTEEVVTHSHGSEGEHAHESLAFTTWIDFNLAAKQAKAIANALNRKKPDLSDAFEKGYQLLEKNLQALDEDIKNIVEKNQSRPLLASHPVYDYFIKRYGLNVKSVHWEPDRVPGDKQMMELRSILKEHHARWMIWEGKPVNASIEKLKSVGVNSLIFDPCGIIPDEGDFMSVMRENVANLRTAF
jgi:zinc transport system substrate-binding protein